MWSKCSKKKRRKVDRVEEWVTGWKLLEDSPYDTTLAAGTEKECMWHVFFVHMTLHPARDDM